ncbi:MAG: outer membrane protein assembly factor BamB family protein [Pirellulales bacterium]
MLDLELLVARLQVFLPVPLQIRASHRASQTCRFSFLALLTSVVLALFSSNCYAQFGLTVPSNTNELGVLLEAPREVKRIFQKADEAIEDERWTDAVELINQVLNSSEIEDYFNNPQAGGTTSGSLKQSALKQLGEIPSSGLEAYDLLFSSDAKAKLEEAVKQQDISLLAEVSRFYFHTQAGHEATILLSRYHLDQGQPLAAAMRLQPLFLYGSRFQQYETEISLLLAFSWYQGGMTGKTVDTLKEFKKRSPNAKIMIGDSETKMFADSEDPLQWIENLVGQPSSFHHSIPSQWVMYRGDPTRNAESQGSEPLRGLNWHVRLARSKQDADALDEISKQYIEQKVAALPMLQPLIVKQQILFRTPWHMLGVDIESGKIIWNYPWESPESPSGTDSLSSISQETSPADLIKLRERIWSDGSYGQFTSDGDRVFLIEDADRSTLSGFNARIPLFRSSQAAAPNQLRCLDLHREGATIWVTSNGVENGLREARFLGAPLALENSLYCLVEINGEIRLVVLSSEDGSLQWSQQLVQVDRTSQAVDPMRHTFGASPSYSEGILVCPTNVGVVVAIDVFNRSLLWGTQYKVLDRKPPNSRMNRSVPTKDFVPGKRWYDATVTIEKDRVLLTPPESEELICLDLTTGKTLWKKDREEGLFLGSVHNDSVLVVNSDSVTAVDLETGKSTWDSLGSTFPLEAMPSGRGFRSGNSYFLPTTAKFVLKINLETGKFAAPIESQGVLGNLVCHGKYVISQGVNLVTSFKQIDALREEVEILLEENPDDFVALRDYGKLLVHDGNSSEALIVLRKSINVQRSDETLQVFIKTALIALQEDFTKYEELIEELESYIHLPEDRLELSRLSAIGYHQRNENKKAFTAYLHYLDQQEKFLSSASHEQYLVLDDNALSVHRDRWVRGNLVDLRDKSDSETVAWMETQLENLLKNQGAKFDDHSSDDNSDIDQMRRFILRFDSFSITHPLRLQLATRLIENSKYLEAELLLNSLVALKEEPLIAGQATAKLAQMLTHLGQSHDAAIYYRLLATEFRDIRCANGRTGKQIAALMISNDAASKVIREQPVWPYTQVSISKSPYDTSPFPRFDHPIQVNYRNGENSFREKLQLDQDTNHIRVLSPYGDERIRIPFSTINGSQLYNAQIGTIFVERTGHLLVTSLGSEVQAFDAFNFPANESRERLLWKEELKPQFPGTAPRKVNDVINSDNPFGDQRHLAYDPTSSKPIGRLSAVSRHGICYQRVHRMICKDPITGQSNWERNGFAEGCYLVADEHRLVVIPPTDNNTDNLTENATIISLDNGAILGQATVPTPKLIWTTMGTTIVTWKATDDGLELVGFDPIENKNRWSITTEYGTKGAIFDGTQIALLAPNGTFKLINISDGTSQIETQIRSSNDLTKIKLSISQDTFQLLTYQTNQVQSNGVTYRSIPNDGNQKLVNGDMYSFDRHTGELIWSSPERISNYHFWADLQPAELPVIAFLSKVNRNNAPTPQLRNAVSILVIDKRDGRVLLRDNLDMYTTAFMLEGDPDRHEVKLKLAEGELVFKYGSKTSPAAPAPPVSTEREFKFPKQVKSLPVSESSLIPTP